MPHYFFHLRDGNDLYRDLEGAELPDLIAARHSATKLARTLIGVAALEGSVPLHLKIEIHDETARACWTIAFGDTIDLILPRATTPFPLEAKLKRVQSRPYCRSVQ